MYEFCFVQLVYGSVKTTFFKLLNVLDPSVLVEDKFSAPMLVPVNTLWLNSVTASRFIVVRLLRFSKA
jgi:hypothetical protein